MKGTRQRICLLCSITHCKRGHEFTEENTKLGKDNRRICVECRRIRGRISDAKRRVKKKKKSLGIVISG